MANFTYRPGIRKAKDMSWGGIFAYDPKRQFTTCPKCKQKKAYVYIKEDDLHLACESCGFRN